MPTAGRGGRVPLRASLNLIASDSVSILQFLTKVHFDYGSRRELPGELARNAVRRPLFVTDKGLIAAGVFAMAIEPLGGTGDGAVFDATPANPTEDAAEAGYAMYGREQCDGIVAIGGGASLDLAKAIAVLCGDPAPLWEYCNRHPAPRPVANTPPLIVLPTTAGSGSEVGRSAVIIFRNGIKAGVGCPNVIKAAICDPELTLGLPPYMTAATGMDALSHCVETYCSPTVNPPADAIALDGLERVYANIERATADGGDRDARWNMMMGALEGAICFQKGLGAVHSMSHALGALNHHHGTLNAILLPHVIDYNKEVLAHKLPILRATMGLAPDADLARVFLDLNARLGLPPGLQALGVDVAIFDAIADASLADNAHKTNPRPLSRQDYLGLLKAAY
jgi:alcohol dehydrogenase class IV